MVNQSKIEWTHRAGTVGRTWNPVVGCSKVSPGCDHCYALRQSHRLQQLASYRGLTTFWSPDGRPGYDWSGEVRCLPERLSEPLTWKQPSTVFVCSMSDLFNAGEGGPNQVPWDFVGAVFDTMIACPQHTFLLLTKRPGKMAFCAGQMEMVCKDRGLPWSWPPNVWAGTSVESQEYAPRLDLLARVPAKVRFVSVEPMLGPVDIQPWLDAKAWVKDRMRRGHLDYFPEHGAPVHWVIVGGESGPGARPMHPDWARDLREQCQTAGVPFFYKQWGEWAPFRDNGPLPANCRYVGLDGAVREGDALQDSDACMGKVGKKLAGAVLDGREWREWPA